MADEIDDMIEVVDGNLPIEDVGKEEYVPIYKMYEDSKIPVSKATGSFWENRKKDGMKLMRKSGELDRWAEAIEYYQNDQGSRGDRRRGLNEIAKGTDTGTEQDYLTENIVFANTSALVPALYAKNPDIEITAEKVENEKKALMYERLVDSLLNRKVAPGLNIKPKMKKATVMALLTNLSYLDLSYVRKDDSSDEALSELQNLATQLTKATGKELKEIEGKLIAIEKKVSMLSPAGPKIAVRHPKLVIVDPSADDSDPNSASYMIVGEFVLTSLLNAIYTEKDENGVAKSIYKPTHVINGNGDEDGMEATVNNFTLLGEDQDYQQYGFNSEEEFESSCRTLVWNVYDKATRRILMFHDKDWSYPIWVWDDPYRLTRFFPIFPLSYYTDPVERNARSEVSYYMDQQDELNKMAQERSRMRHWVMTKVLFDTNSIKDRKSLEQMLSGATTESVFGFEVPEGKKISDVVMPFPAPSTQFEGLFDTRPILEAVSRLSSVTPTLQNVQYKTNTTNKAIESYESSTQLRLDEKIDAMEELLADVSIALIEMCIQFMDEQTVIDLIGEKLVSDAGGWPQGMTPQEFHAQFNVKVVGGSTLKPTSKVKKEQAMQMTQMLGQFASANPVVVVIMLKMLERAFADDMIITDEDWEVLTSSMEKAIQGQGKQGGEGGQEILAQLSQMLEQAPPQIKQQVGQAIAQGMPLQQVVAKFMEMAKQAQQGQQQQQPQQPQRPQQ